MPAMSQDELKGRAEALSGDLTAWRRDLHRRPELGFEEHETAAYLKSRLEPLELDELREGVAQTGVVGVLRAPEPSGPAVLLRADMDALPIQEVEERPYVSEIPGRMHACEHFVITLRVGCTPAVTTATCRCCWGRRPCSPSGGTP